MGGVFTDAVIVVEAAIKRDDNDDDSGTNEEEDDDDASNSKQKSRGSGVVFLLWGKPAFLKAQTVLALPATSHQQ